MNTLTTRFVWLVLLVALVMTGVCTDAVAVELCVRDVADLNAALVVAAGGQSTVIKLAQGTYAVAGSTVTQVHAYGPVQLLGGYTSDCAARTLQPSNTVFDGGMADAATLIANGDVRVEGVTFRNFHDVALLVEEDQDDGYVKVANNVFDGVGAVVTPHSAGPFSLSFNNNLVHDYHGTQWSTAVWLVDDGPLHVDGNTIVDTGDVGLQVCGHGEVELGNNIVWNNAGRDVRVSCDSQPQPRSALFQDNLYGTIYGSEATGSYGSLHTDPLFTNAAGGNYHLQDASAAINSGNAALSHPGVDLDGNPRVVGSTIDRGAYESAVDDTIPATLTVTNTNDSGAGSLRQAILDANANPDFTFIDFDIAGACPHTIAVTSANLPTLTNGVRIDGYSQPGSSANSAVQGDNATRCIVLNGLGQRTTGLAFSGSSDEQFWLQGLVVEGFTSNGLSISGGTGALVWGNQFGGRFHGATLLPNGNNILLVGNSHSAQVGGDAPAQLNVIDGATTAGVLITGLAPYLSTGNRVIGNLIGTWGGETGVLVGNAVGVELDSSNNTVRDNVIVGSGSDGVRLGGAFASHNTVQGNRIGRTDTVCVILPVPFCYNDDAANARHGVRIDSGAHDNLVQSNTIWYNAATGISVAGSGKGNELSANSIYQNAGYGIDLEGVGANDNDADPNAANLPNRGLNYPVPLRAYGGARRGSVEGTLSSTNGSYLIQVFSSATADNEPTGEGETFHRIGIAQISNAGANGNGSDSFRIAFSSPAASLAGRVVTLTAIDEDGNTSEFSSPVAYACDVIYRNGFDDAEGDQCPQP